MAVAVEKVATLLRPQPAAAAARDCWGLAGLEPARVALLGPMVVKPAQPVAALQIRSTEEREALGHPQLAAVLLTPELHCRDLVEVLGLLGMARRAPQLMVAVLLEAQVGFFQAG
jgi:hypothetical protein